MLKSLHLTLLIGPTVPVPVPGAFIDALESVRATAGMERDSFELKFRLNKRSDLTNLLTIVGAQLPELRVILICTLRGVPQPIFDGVMTHHQVDPAGTGAILVIQGYDLTTVMDRDDQTGLFQYPCMTPSVRVRAILARYARFGLIPMVFPSLAESPPDITDKTPVHKGTDLEYIKQLAEEVGNTFFIAPGPVPGTNLAYWGPPMRIGLPQPPLDADMDAHRNVDSVSFRMETEQHEQPDVTFYEPITKLPIRVPIPSFSPLRPPMGLIRPLAKRRSRADGSAKKPFAEALIAGFAKVSRSQETVFASGSLNVSRYGHVLRAKHLVSVRGSSSPFNGLYHVDSVTHEIARGKYTQNFELSRDGLVSTVPLAPMVTA